MERYRMCVLVFAAFAAMGTGNVLAQAPAGEETTGECRLYHGGGGDRVFPEWTTTHKVVVIPHEQKASVWLPEVCGLDPERIRIEASTELLGWNLELTEWHARGVRVTFKAKAGTEKVATKVVISTSARSFELEVRLGPTYEAAVTASLQADIVSLRKETGELRAALSVVDGKSDRAVGQSDAALGKAHEARARTKAGVEILINPMINFNTTPGVTGGGVGLNLSGELGRFANDKVHLGLAGSISWHRYELEILGFQNVNTDLFGHSTDILVKFMVKVQPARFIGLYLETGLGIRLFDHMDAVTLQEATTLYIRGVEGSCDIHPLWGLEAGFRVYPYKWLIVGVGFHAAVSLTRQINRPSGDPHITPERAHVWNYGLIFSVGARL